MSDTKISAVKNFFCGLKNKLTEKDGKKLLIWIGGALLFIIAVLVICLSLKSDRVGKALDSSNYDRVQVRVAQSFVSNDTDSSSADTSSDGENGDYTSEIYQNGYYDENGEFVADSSTASDGTSSDSTADEPQEISVLKKDGDVYYEEGLSGKCYYYTRDGKDYVMYYDDFYGINKDNGKWTEVPAENYSIAPSFDFSVLDKIKKSDLKKSGDYYVPKKDTEQVFFDVLKIQNKQYYSDCGIKFSFEKGKITGITADYIFKYTGTSSDSEGQEYTAKLTYTFSYNDEEIKLPKADVTNEE